jgi:hypothetical protein
MGAHSFSSHLKAFLSLGRGSKGENMANEMLRVPPRAVFAAVVLSAKKHPISPCRQGWPTLGDLTQKIIDLKRQYHLDTTDISIRADKGGWISDDLSSFVNRFVLFGLASQNPVDLSQEAVERCVEIIRKDMKDQAMDVDRLVKALNLNAFIDESSAAPKAVASNSL